MRSLLATTALSLALMLGHGAFAVEETKTPPAHAEALAKLPEAKRTLVQEMLKSGKEERKANREAMKADQAEIEKILTAPTFDKKAFLAKTAEIEAKRASQHTKRSEKLAEVAGQLTAEERKILVEILPKPGQRKQSKKETPATDTKAPTPAE